MRQAMLRGICLATLFCAGASAQQAELRLVPQGATTINPGQTIEFQVFIDAVVAPLDPLRTYQVAVTALPQAGSVGVMQLADLDTGAGNTSIFIDNARPDYVFVNESPIEAVNVSKSILGATLLFSAIDVPTIKYAGTYIFKASDDAIGNFAVAFQLTDPSTGNRSTFLKTIVDNRDIPFFISPTSITVTVEPPPEVPPNDLCADSLPLSDGSTAFNTENGTTDGPALPALCDEGAGLSMEQDVWFDYTATCSGVLTISTCDDADFDTKLAVYGDGSGVCQCPADNTSLLTCSDDVALCVGGTSEVVMAVVQGACYTVRVGGPGLAQGRGNLTVTCTPDLCTDAQPLAVPASVAGSTDNTIVNDAIGPDCGTGVVDSPGVWYSVVGTGNRMSASLCNGASYDTRLSVFEGGCGGLTCVADANNTCGNRESVDWCSSPGVSYLILVHGVAGASGDFVLDVSDSSCNDADLCTDDSCVSGVCLNVVNFDDTTLCCAPSTGNLTVIEDGNPCTADICTTSGSVTHPPVADGPEPACEDGIRCTLDACQSGQCVSTPINDQQTACTNDADCPSSAICGDGTRGSTPGICFCDPGSPLILQADPSGLPVEGCYSSGDQLTVRVLLGNGDRSIVGVQFFLEYDASTLVLTDIQPGASVDPLSPFTIVLNESVDPFNGTVDYGISVNLLDPGTRGPTTLAVLTFDTIAECDSYVLFRPVGTNGALNRLVSFGGEEVFPDLFDLPPIMINAVPPVLSGCPADITVTAAPGMFSRAVSWPAPVGADSCDGNLAVTCSPPSGTVFMPGTTTVTCETTNMCGGSDFCTFNVTVETSQLVVDLELSPTMAAGPLDRCIIFDLWDCDGPPGVDHVVVEQVVTFAGGMANGINVQIPGGAWECLTVRDGHHTLRSTAADFSTVDGINYTATFVGNRATGGHWLVGGNLNGDNFVDILDFGVLSPFYLSLSPPDTTCSSPLPDVNINGDNRVDLLDLVFITGNWIQADEPECCPVGGVSAISDTGSLPIESITIDELRRLGLTHLIQADVNGDGILDLDDAAALVAHPEDPPEDDGNRRRLGGTGGKKHGRRDGRRR